MSKLGFQARIVLISLAAAFPASAALLILLWTGDHEPQMRYGLSLMALGALSGGLILLYRKLTFQFQTLANVVSAIREGDFSIRARGGTDKGLGEFAAELNVLGEVLRRQRLGAVEAAALLQKVMKEIDVAVFAFDDGWRLRLINRAGQRLLRIPGEEALDKSAEELDLKDCLKGEPIQTLQIQLPGGSGRWGMHRIVFREEGRPHHLVVLTDLNQTLREEERQAWRRLIRVLGHELTTSLTPIHSLARSPESLLEPALSTSAREPDLRA
ncbi:MAG: PAS domain-containing sensor histidine kinase, partial [Candidatus Aminicenantes bacterium]|nr:PAS domain-containing sensor histidine kinase [Candidatus Aminicenantes bacterium]